MDMNNNTQPVTKKSSSSKWLAIVIGAAVVGLGVGLVMGQPGFGLIIGLGASVLLWGLTAVFKK